MKLFWRKFFSVLLLSSIFLTPAFSKKKKNVQLPPEPEPITAPVVIDQEETEFSEMGATKLAVPEKKEHTFFELINPEILENVCNGSPESLRLAVNSLKRSSASFLPAEKVLYDVSVSMLKILWPSVLTTENVTLDGEDSYSAAVKSAKQGIYDFNTGNTDFLTRALPSLVLAVSESRSDYYEEAEKSLKQCLEEKQDSVFVNYLLGLLYSRQDKNEEALASFKNAESYSPDNFELLKMLVLTNYELKNHEEALRIAEQLLEKNNGDKELLKLCAYSAFESGLIDKAEIYVNRVLQGEPGNSQFVLFRTKILIARGEYIRAASLLDAYARTDTSSRDYLILRFKVQKEWNKNTSGAVATIEKALNLYPDDEEIILAAASIASENNVSINGWSGDELAEQILEKNPESYTAKKIKINSMIQKKNWSQAYAISQELLKHPQADGEAIFTHIKICLSAQKKDEAWRLASDLYSKNPHDEAVLQTYIDVLVSTSRRNEATKIINQLLPSSSAKLKSFLYYEKSLMSSDENSVLADLRSSLTANPRNKDSLFRLYTIYFNRKEYKKAQYYLKQVVALSPKDENLLNLNRQLEKLINN